MVVYRKQLLSSRNVALNKMSLLFNRGNLKIKHWINLKVTSKQSCHLNVWTNMTLNYQISLLFYPFMEDTAKISLVQQCLLLLCVKYWIGSGLFAVFLLKYPAVFLNYSVQVPSYILEICTSRHSNNRIWLHKTLYNVIIRSLKCSTLIINLDFFKENNPHVRLTQHCTQFL